MKKHLQKANKLHLTAALSVVAIAIAGLLVVANGVVTSKTSQKPLTNVLGLTATNNFYNLEVSGVLVGPADAKTATRRATINITLHNTSNEVLQVSPGLQMFLVGSTGKVYSMTAKYLPAGSTIGGPIGSGGSATMSVDYDIAGTETPKTFTYQPDSSKPIASIGL